MKAHANIIELIERFESEIDALNAQISTLKKKPQNFNEQVLFKYIDTGSTGKTKDFVRALGIMSERGSMFSSADVSKIIKDGPKDVSPELLAIARKVMGMKKRQGKH